MQKDNSYPRARYVNLKQQGAWTHVKPTAGSVYVASTIKYCDRYVGEWLGCIGQSLGQSLAIILVF